MAVASASKTSSSSWSKLFPTELGLEVRSLVFIKKLFAVSVSYALYARNLFPESAFLDKQLEGIKLKILKEDSSFPGPSKVVYWLRGCFDAIDRRYLKTAIITLYSSENAPALYSECQVIEAYIFKLSYGAHSTELLIAKEDKNTPSCNGSFGISSTSADEIQKTTINLLKAIGTAGSKLKKLTGNMFMTMELQYNNDAPEDYIPPGFKDASKITFNFNGTPANVRIGTVQTVSASNKDDSVQMTDSQTATSKVDELGESMHKQTLESEPEEIFDVRCPCGVHSDDGVMIVCDGCSAWQHAVCFRILDEEDVPSSHICEHCSESKPDLLEKGGITDPTLQGIPEVARRSLCLFRRAVLLSTSQDSLSPAIISKNLEVEYTVARGLFNRLLKEGILKQSGTKRGERLVEKEYLESTVLTKIFRNAGEVQKTVPDLEKIDQFATQAPSKPISSCPTPSVRRTPRRSRPDSNTSKDDSNELQMCSQDSTQSPLPAKRSRKSGIASTPISVVHR